MEETWGDRQIGRRSAVANGDWAVGYYHSGRDVPILFHCVDRAEADKAFKQLINTPESQRIILNSGHHAGRASALVFIVQFRAGAWSLIKGTEGAQQKLGSSGLPLPDQDPMDISF
jgi:hypothetical protein